MTVPGEKSYWITDSWSDDSAEEKLNARTDQMWDRLDVALPGPSTKEGISQLAAVALFCMEQLPREIAAHKVIAPIALNWKQKLFPVAEQLNLLEAAQ